MKFHYKIILCVIALVTVLLCLLGGCRLAENIIDMSVFGRHPSLSDSTALSSSEASSSAPVLKEITLYPAVGAVNEAQREILLNYAAQNYRELFNFQVGYISDNKVTSTNVILPTGHTLYEDEKGRFIFSGGSVVYVKGSEETENLEAPDNPLYDYSLMHDALGLSGKQLYDESGVLISFEDTGAFTPVSSASVSYNNIILNVSFAAETLDSTSLNIPLSVFGMATLDDAKAAFANAEDVVMIRNGRYVPVVDNDILTLYFNGDNGFLLDVKSLILPRKPSDGGVSPMLDYYNLEKAAASLYTKALNEMELSPVFEAKDIVPNQKITAYNSFTGKLEEVTPLLTDDQGRLSVSLEALHVLFGVNLVMDNETKTLHVLTDPYYRSFVEEMLGGQKTTELLKSIDEQKAAPEFLQQQQGRMEDTSYLYEAAAVVVESGLPAPVVRTPKTGQFTYPGSHTKIWKSGYAGKSEPADLYPSMEGDWVWNSETGFWEGSSPLSGEKAVWHPSYGAAFTIR